MAVVGIAMPRKGPSLLAPALCSIHRSRFIISASHLSRVFSALRYWVTLYRVSIPIIDSVPPSIPTSNFPNLRSPRAILICNLQPPNPLFLICHSKFPIPTVDSRNFHISQFPPAVSACNPHSRFPLPCSQFPGCASCLPLCRVGSCRVAPSCPGPSEAVLSGLVSSALFHRCPCGWGMAYRATTAWTSQDPGKSNLEIA